MEPNFEAYKHLLDDSSFRNIKVKTHSLFAYSKYEHVNLDIESTKNLDINNLSEVNTFVFNQIPKGYIGFGGYLENRNIYHRGDTTSDYQIEGEPRTIHLALDFWTLTNTPVYSVLNGNIHSFSFNPAKGQFGGCIITEHFIGERFYLLYGHLSAKSIQRFKIGQKISAGELIGFIGDENENGQWPPHLHFQLIKDIGNFRGDYFGVAAKSQLTFFKLNCPNPNLILNIE
ncbi:peptidoglycan DD-metalloendopeptidase family protein [Arcicella sp. DC2W]|uniref:Peptidoglycan DD-metalloendopeptidase family protein n=1 Tax=Arcicella gelida TaxID=2984195 RepID=A0ABU5S0V5_9BACT|nr:peptidoglycan DD-metalloendopeptidase family protein [Arcicella sp. DC2W]MEA5402103.1 peptidoglycan DD-metalloendopeptidase family protein [Arcicella sp. DC2W]